MDERKTNGERRTDGRQCNSGCSKIKINFCLADFRAAWHVILESFRHILENYRQFFGR